MPYARPRPPTAELMADGLTIGQAAAGPLDGDAHPACSCISVTAPGATVTHPDLLLKPVAVSVPCFLVPVAVVFSHATWPYETRVILTNGECPISISR